jgi:mannose-1-phosphate guanylyltransferase
MMKRTDCGKHIEEKHFGAVKTAPLCGLVLAGGEGQRLRPFVMRLRGDALPKQYVTFSGSRSMIEHTYRRAEMLIPRERLFTIINRAHLNFAEVKHQLRDRHRGTVIVQPTNRETGPGLLLPLTYIHKRYPDAVVAVFPSDQFILETDRLMRHIELAHGVVERDRSRLVLLGITPDYEEQDYGYIVPGTARNGTDWGIQNVQTFIEKPDGLRAGELISQGGLWNTMLIVFNVATLFSWVKEIEPELYGHFARIYDAIGTRREANSIQAAYGELRAVNFSKELLEPVARRYPGRLAVLPVTDVTWSDWGTERRILSSLKKIGRRAGQSAPVAAVKRPHPPSAKGPDRSVAYTL